MEYTWSAPDNSLIKTIIKKGIGYENPQEGATVCFHISEDDSHLLKEFDNGQVILGEADSFLTHYFEMALKTMKEGEESELSFSKMALSGDLIKLKTKPNHCKKETISHPDTEVELKEDTVLADKAPKVDESGHVKKSIKNQDKSLCANSANGFIFEKDDYIKVKFSLTSFTRQPEINKMSITEKWRRFHHHKSKGVEVFGKKQYFWAFKRFSKALKYLISLEYKNPSEDKDQPATEVKSFKLSCYLNLAACQLINRNYEHAIINCTKGLAIDPNHPKALYRRGTAYTHIQEYEKAKVDLDKALEVDPNCQAILKQQKILKDQVHKLNQYYAGCMKKLFA